MLLLPLLFLVVVAVFIACNVRVPAGTLAVVERLGKFHKALGAGRAFILPFIDRVACRISLEPQQDTFKWTVPMPEDHRYHITLALQWQVQATSAQQITMVAYQFQDMQRRTEAIGLLVKRVVAELFAGRNTAVTFMDFEPFTLSLKPQLETYMQSIGLKLTGLQLKDLYRE